MRENQIETLDVDEKEGKEETHGFSRVSLPESDLMGSRDERGKKGFSDASREEGEGGGERKDIRFHPRFRKRTSLRRDCRRPSGRVRGGLIGDEQRRR